MKTITDRKTQKVISEKPLPLTEESENKKLINELLELASFAPYHKKCEQFHQNKNKLNSGLPFRIHVLTGKNCRKLYHTIEKEGLKTGNIKGMLAASELVFLVTWLPDVPEDFKAQSLKEEISFEPSLKNMEHIAAGSAAIQNILLGATAKNLPNYWSSGGMLRKPTLRERLNIPYSEILLGAVFIFPKNSDEKKNLTIKLGKLRNEGKEIKSFSREIEI